MCIFGSRTPQAPAPLEPPSEPKTPISPASRRRKRRSGQLTTPDATNPTGALGLTDPPIIRRLGTTLG